LQIWHIVSQTSNWVFQTLLNSKRFFNANTMWRLVGFVSNVIWSVMLCSKPLFQTFNWKMEHSFRVLDLWGSFLRHLHRHMLRKGVLISLSTKYDRLIKIFTIFVVLMIISVYSFFYDKAVDGKPDIQSVVSNAMFALVSLSLHKLFNSKSEIGVFSYFLCCFTVQLFTINKMWIFVAIIYGFLLSFIHSSQNSIPDVASGRQVVQV